MLLKRLCFWFSFRELRFSGVFCGVSKVFRDNFWCPGAKTAVVTELYQLLVVRQICKLLNLLLNNLSESPSKHESQFIIAA